MCSHHSSTMMTLSSPIVDRQNVFGRLPAYNPFVGTFHHAPSAGNRGAIYFSGDILCAEELEERKKLRQNPLTGTFHALPGYYDPLHGLRHFRSSDDEGVSDNNSESTPSSSRTESPTSETVRAFFSIDSDSNFIRGRLDSDALSRVLHRMYSDSKLGQEVHTSRLCRRNSDPVVLDTTNTPGIEEEVYVPREDRPSDSGSFPSDNRSSMGSITNDGIAWNDDDDASDSVGSTASESDSLRNSLTNGSDFPSLKRKLLPTSSGSTATNPCEDGFISTGKGIFRKFAFMEEEDISVTNSKKFHREHNSGSSRASFDDSRFRFHSCDSPTSSSSVADKKEYKQVAPRIPTNPFLTRRLKDRDQLKVMPVDRTCPRGIKERCFGGSAESDDEDEHEEHPKPYFIHEQAVTNEYDLVGEDQLGDGSYAVVKPGVRKENGVEVAIKQVHKRYLCNEQALKAVETEVEIHQRLRHRNIVRLYEIYETEDFLYLVMAKANSGTLKQLMTRHRRFSETVSRRLIKQLMAAVFYLHEHGVLHCDLKPENILLTSTKSESSTQGANPSWNDYQIVICDFGLAMKVPDVRFYKYTGDVHKVPFTGMTGTPGYISPELMDRQPYGNPVDMWSIGIIVYEMLVGYQPFYPPEACLKEAPDFNPRVWKKFSPEAKDLVENLLHPDPSKRFTAQQALSHEWFESATFSPV